MFRLKLTALISALMMSIAAFGQHLTTTTPTYDCGQVMFRVPVSTTFTLKNKSSKTLTISEVLTSCGCTAASTSAKTVEGGKEIELTATYDAKQLGHFQKTVWVYEEGQNKPLELTLKGVVVTELKDYSGTYPVMLGQIRADKNVIEFDDVNRGMVPQQQIHIFNSTGSTIQPVVMHLPAYITADVSPTRIAPNEGGVVTLTLNSAKVRDNGLTQTSLYLGKFPGDKVAQAKEIETSVIILPSFNVEEMDDAYDPRVEISATTLRMSEMSGKPDKLKGEITLQNIGHSELEISSMQMFTAGMRVSLGKTRLNPGEQTKLKIQANSNELRQQRSRPRILMITNDPKQPKIVIEIKD